MTDWNERFMQLAQYIAGWSKDRSTGVGCVLVGTGHNVVAMGYNGFPRGCNDSVEARHERPLKYMWTEHAERNAIYNAARNGVQLQGCSAYVYFSGGPCADCARALAQAGISTVFIRPMKDNPRWSENLSQGESILRECGVHVEVINLI
jgi:dCMP deaminase